MITTSFSDFVSLLGCDDPYDTKFTFGDTVELTGLNARPELNGMRVIFKQILEDGCIMCKRMDDGSLLRTKLCNIKYPHTDIEVTQDMHSVFPRLNMSLNSLERIEIPMHMFSSDTYVECKSGIVVGRDETHRKGASLDIKSGHIVLTIWEVLDCLSLIHI